MDKAFPDSGWSKKVLIPLWGRTLLLFKKKDNRERHMLLAFVFNLLGYLLMLLSVVVFVPLLINGRVDQMLYSSIASFACLALGAIVYIFEMLVFLIAEIKQDRSKGEQE